MTMIMETRTQIQASKNIQINDILLALPWL